MNLKKAGNEGLGLLIVLAMLWFFSVWSIRPRLYSSTARGRFLSVETPR